jgi:hypothetical protein
VCVCVCVCVGRCVSTTYACACVPHLVVGTAFPPPQDTEEARRAVYTQIAESLTSLTAIDLRTPSPGALELLLPKTSKVGRGCAGWWARGAEVGGMVWGC